MESEDKIETVRKPPRVVIVGGGLAGMTVAYKLLQHSVEVVLLEAASRLGGKAGADLVSGRYQEHGNHFFPPWYLNTRRLMHELGILDNLVDLKKLHQVERGRFPRLKSLIAPTRLLNLPWNLFFADHLPWADSALLVYSFLDLACQGDGNPEALDERSFDEFLSSRPYCRDPVRQGAQAMIMKSIATPTHRLSAMTEQTIVRYWLRYRAPMYSILSSNLQEGLVQPFERKLRSLGCRIELGCPVLRFCSCEGRISGVRVKRQSEQETVTADAFVSALPCEELVRVMDAPLTQNAGLQGVGKLESVPMGAMTLYLKRTIPGLPKEHVILEDSLYGLSFIDVSKTWSNCPGSVLTFNIGEVGALLTLSPHQAAMRVIAELSSFIKDIRPEDIDHYDLRLNVQTPLLMNSIGSWRHRPVPGRTAISNLFVAGDYCRSTVNVTSMEGAVASGLAVAAAILRDYGMVPDWKILEPAVPPPYLLKFIRNILFPGMMLLGRMETSPYKSPGSHLGGPAD